MVFLPFSVPAFAGLTGKTGTGTYLCSDCTGLTTRWGEGVCKLSEEKFLWDSKSERTSVSTRLFQRSTILDDRTNSQVLCLFTFDITSLRFRLQTVGDYRNFSNLLKFSTM